MTGLGLLLLLMGVAFLVIYGPLVTSPAVARKGIAAFPRYRVAAWVLAAVDLVWAAWHLYHMPLGILERYKPLLFILTPVAFGLIVTFVDELLAARALGGLFLLLPTPMLLTARWQPVFPSYIVLVLAYILVVKGMILVLNPYMFRRWASWVIKTDGRMKLCGALGAGFGLAMVILAFAAA